MVCCVTGHRPKGFPFPREKNNFFYSNYLVKLKKEIEILIEEGYGHFICGMAEGADLDFAECILNFRDSGMSISLEAALPYPTPARTTTRSLVVKKREFLLSTCDSVIHVSPFYFKGCMQKRNTYMVDHADIVLAIWNGDCHGGTWNTIEYARKLGKNIRYIRLSDNLP